MGRWVEAKAGDCITSIAADHGFREPNTIYNAPENAELRKKRPDPSQLVAGDRVFIPDRKVKEILCKTGQRHLFKAKTLWGHVRLNLHDELGKPYGGKKYKLVVMGTTHEGTTGPDGLVDQRVPPNAHEAQLTLYVVEGKEEEALKFKLEIGDLRPATTIEGIRDRLRNLGYDVGGDEERGHVGRRTAAAIEEFQAAAGLPQSGEMDDATRSALLAAHP
jgi:N-acetylmuramoyl-L-alanine amidase